MMDALAIIGLVITVVLVFVPPLWDRDNWQKTFGVNIPPIYDWLSNQWVKMGTCAVGAALLVYVLLKRKVSAAREEIKELKSKILEMDAENKNLKNRNVFITNNITNNFSPISVNEMDKFRNAAHSFRENTNP